MLAFLCAAVLAVAAADQDAPAPAEQAAIAEALAPALVRVEYTLQYDKGQSPASSGWSERCPNCGQYHGSQLSELIADERPYETAGFLLGEKTVITQDGLIHPRFVKSIVVRYKDQVRTATWAGYARAQNALLLEMDAPLAGARPLAFSKSQDKPFFGVCLQRQNGIWTTSLQTIASKVSITEAGHRFRPAGSYCLITDKAGKPVGMSMSDELPIDDSWQGSPEQWPLVDRAAMKAMLESLETKCQSGLVRVSLYFRSAQVKAEDRWNFRRYNSDGEEDKATLRHALGVVLDDRRVLVLASLPQTTTARLERVALHLPSGPVPAKFAGTLMDFGALLVTASEPLRCPLALSNQPAHSWRNALLLAAQVTVKGEQWTGYYQHTRIASFNVGWHGIAFPEMAGGSQDMFLFDEKGALIALPISRRKKVTVREEYQSNETVLMPAALLASEFKNSGCMDPSNVPVGEEQENRLAWLGVELQGLTKELARINKVSDLTNDGATGALVTFVYPDSPAAAAGVEQGDVLLRLYVEGQPKPLDIQVEENRWSMSDYPWDKLSTQGIPPEYLNQLPKPWQPAENAFTRALTELGFGTPYKAEFWHAGKALTRDFKVVQSPAHFDSAPRFKSTPMGLTVRDLTFEVRRYYQLEPKAPGVVVSRLEPGGKAQVAGVLPYEMITHVNDQPVMSADTFDRLTRAGGELRLSVKRQNKGRLVKINLPATTAPSSQPASKPAS